MVGNRPSREWRNQIANAYAIIALWPFPVLRVRRAFGPESALVRDKIMLPFRKILFPVDYSPSCSAIVPYVKEMVRHFAGQLTLVHAYGPEALAYSELPSDPELNFSKQDWLQKL